jgi:DNA-binding TFAR19-related protein (PDSD5 family)
VPRQRLRHYRRKTRCLRQKLGRSIEFREKRNECDGSTMNEVEKKVLKMLLDKKCRSRIKRKIGITDDIFMRSIREINKNGYDFVIKNQKKNKPDPEESFEDKLVYEAMKKEISEEDYKYMLKNLYMPRTQLAKQLKISKLALNFILDKGL